MDLLTLLLQQYGGWGLLLFGLFLLFMYQRSEAIKASNRATAAEKRTDELDDYIKTDLKQQITTLKNENEFDRKQDAIYRTEAERKIHELSERVSDLVARLSEIRLLYNAEKAANNELEAYSQKLQDINEKLVKDNAAAKIEIEKMRTEMDALAARIKTLEEEANNLRTEAVQLKTEAEQRAQESASREARIVELQARMANQEQGNVISPLVLAPPPVVADYPAPDTAGDSDLKAAS